MTRKVVIIFVIIICIITCALIVGIIDKEDKSITKDIETTENLMSRFNKSSEESTYNIYDRDLLESKLPVIYFYQSGLENMVKSSRRNIKEIDDIISLDDAEVKKTDDGYIVICHTEETIFAIKTDDLGYIQYTIYQGRKFPNKEQRRKIKKGMTFQEVKEIVPEAFLSTKTPQNELRENPLCEIVFNDGKMIDIIFKKYNNEIFVDYIDVYRIDKEEIQLMDMS